MFWKCLVWRANAARELSEMNLWSQYRFVQRLAVKFSDVLSITRVSSFSGIKREDGIGGGLAIDYGMDEVLVSKYR